MVGLVAWSSSLLNDVTRRSRSSAQVYAFNRFRIVSPEINCMSFPRAAGILLHPSSLPSRGGIGDLGPRLTQFADFLASARQGLWQVLPLGPLGYGNSPYSSTSAFAGNPLLISLERLADHGWIEPENLIRCLPSARPWNTIRSLRRKMPLLFEAGEISRDGVGQCSRTV